MEKWNNNFNNEDNEKLYQQNINELIKISQSIDSNNEYSSEIRNDNIFIKLLFKDLRDGSKFYEKSQWKPIKTAIQNCYKLIQNGYTAGNQIELKNNIIILNKLIKDLQKINTQNIDEESVVKDVLESSLKTFSPIENEEFKKRFKLLRNESVDNNNNEENITKEYFEMKLKEQKDYYENKLFSLNDKVSKLENELKDLKSIFSKFGGILSKYNNENLQ